MIKWVKYKNPFIKDNNDSDTYLDQEKQFTPSPILNGVTITPFGAIAFENMNLDDTFNFWVGHTNTELTTKACTNIEKVPGVEVLTIGSRYRFRVGIGQVFNENVVKKEIEDILYIMPLSSYNLPDSLKRDILQTKDKVAKKKFWFIYVSPSGNIEVQSTDDDKMAIDERISAYSDIQKTTGGYLFKSTTLS